MKKITLFILLLLSTNVYSQLPVGTVRKAVTTDTNGWVINTSVNFSNQVLVVITPTNNNQIVRYQELTNNLVISTNIFPIPVSRGGIGVQTTQLLGSWTNSINFRVNGTNDSNAYSVKGILGFTGSITNLGPSFGSSNVLVYTTGILTNRFTIP